MKERHSVRQYKDDPIPEEIRSQLNRYAGYLSYDSGLRIQIFYDEPECFGSGKARFGKFENCRNYIEFIEKELEVPVTMVSNGPERHEIIRR